MDETVDGGKPEETVEQAVAEETKAAAPPEGTPGPPAPPYYNRPVVKKDWLVIALVAVSTIAVLLLASTIVLAVTRDHRDGRGEIRFNSERGQMPMMQRRMQGGGSGQGNPNGSCDGTCDGSCDSTGNSQGNSNRSGTCDECLPLQPPNTPAPQSAPQQPAQ